MASNSTELIFSQSAFDNLLKILDKVEKKLDDVKKTTGDLKKSSTSVVFKFSGLDSLDNFLEKVSRGKVNQFLDLVTGFERLINVGAKTTGFATFVTTLNQVTGSNLQPLVQTLKTLSTSLDDKSAKRLSDLGKSLSSFAKIGSSETGANGIDTFVKNLTDSLLHLKALSNDDLDNASKNLGRFATGMIKITANLDKVTTGFNHNNSAAKLGVFFGELTTALRVVAGLDKLLGGNDQVKQLSLAIERLGIGVAGLTRNLDKIDLKSTTKLAAFLTGMAVIIRIITTISGNAEKTKALAALFTGIADLVSSVFVKFNTKQNNEAKIFASIKSRVALILDVIKSIRGIKIKDAEGTASVITAVSSLFTSLSAVGGDGVDAGGGLTKATVDLFRNFIGALQDLNKIKVNKDLATALAGIGNIFANLEKTDTLKNAKGFGGSLSSSVALGFIKGTLALDIGKFILRLFTDLNPIVLTAKFVSGVVTAFVGLDTKIRDIFTAIVDKAKAFGSEISNIGTNLVSNFGVGALTSSGGFQIAAEFDDLAQKSKVAGNLTEEQQKQILDLADAIGIKYPLSANDALKAIINLQKAGVQAVPDIQAVIQPIADLASLSDSGDITAATNVVIQSISSFKLLKDGVVSNFDNAATAVDIFSRAADLSTASVESLGAGVANVGPLASQFGLSLEDTVATLALFEDRGIKGAEAGTQLKSVLTNMARPTDTVRDELKKLNISLVDNKGNFRDLNDIFNDFNHAFNDTTKVTRKYSNISKENKDQLNQATKAYAAAQRQIFAYNNGLTTGALNQKEANKKLKEYETVAANAQKAIAKLTGSEKDAKTITTELTRTSQENFESLNKVFGTFGQQGAAILIGAGDDAIKQFEEDMGRLPTAAERAVELLDTFKGSVEQLTGSGETLIKNFFLPLLDTIFKPLVDGFAAIINALILVNPELLATISTGVAFGSILATIVGSVAIASGFLISFGASVLGVVTAFLSVGGVLSIIATMAGAVASLVFGLVSLVAIVAPVAAGLFGLAAAFRGLLRIFSQNIGGASSALAGLKLQLGVLIPIFQHVASSFGEFIGLIFGGQGSDSGITAAGTVISGFITSITQKINVGIQLFGDLAKALDKFLDFTKNGIDPTKLGLEALGKLADNPFISFLLNKQNLDHSAVGVNLLFRSISDGVKAAAAAFSTISSGIGDLFSSFNDPSLLEVGKRKIIDGVSKLSATALKAIAGIFGIDLSAAIADFDSGDLSKGLSDLLTKAVEGVKNLLLNNRGTIKDVLTGIFNFFFVPGGFLTIITDFLGLDNISGIIRSIQDTLSRLFGGVIDTIFNVLDGQDLTTALTNAFGDGIKPVIKFVETLGETVQLVVGFFQTLLAVIFPTTAKAAQFNVLDIVTGVLTFLTDGLRILNDDILKPLTRIIQSIDFGSIFGFISKVFGEFSKFFGLILNGDFSGALDQVKGIGTKLIASIQSLLTDAFNVQFVPSDDLLHAVVRTFSGIISTALNGLSNLLGFENVQGLVDSVIKSINDFFGSNPSAKFAEIGTTVVGAIGKAIIDGLSSLADVLGLDPTSIQTNLATGFKSIVDGINNFFLGDDGKGIFGDIQTIFDKLGQAIKAVLDTFTGGGEASAAGDKLFTITDALNGIVTFLTNLSKLVLTTIGDDLKGIADFFDQLSKLDPIQLLEVVGIIGLVAGAIAILASGGAIIATVAGGLASIAGGLVLVIAALAIHEGIANLGIFVDILRDLTNLDIAGAAGKITEFFGNIAAGVTFDILSLFGIDNINGVTEGSVKDTIQGIADKVASTLTDIGKGFTDFINNTILPAKDTLIKIGLSIGSVLGVILGVARIAINIISSVVGSVLALLASPIILIIKAIQGFAELPQPQKDRVVNFFALLGATFLLYNASSILSIASSIGAMLFTFLTVGVPAALIALPGALFSLGASFIALAAPVLVVVGTVAAIILFITVLKSALDNIDKLFSAVFNIVALLGSIATLDVEGIFRSIGAIIGDIVDFIGSTLVDAFFTVAGFFGFDTVLGQTRDDVKKTLTELVTIIKGAFQKLGIVISNFFRNIFSDLSNKIQIAAADLRLAAEDAAARVRTIGKNAADDPFFKAQAIFDPKTFDLTKLSAALGDSTIDQAALRDFAIKNAGLIRDALITQIQSGDGSSDGLFKIETGIQFAIASNNIDQVVQQVFSLDGDAGKKAQEAFIASLGDALAHGRLNPTEVGSIIDNIFAQVALGTLDPTVAADMLGKLDFTGTNLTPDQIAALKKKIADGIKEATDGAKTDAEANPTTIDPTKLIKVTTSSQVEGDGTGFDFPLPITVTPTVDAPKQEGKNSSFFDDVKKNITDQAANAGVTITPEVPVTPAFTGITNQGDVNKFKDDVVALKDGLVDANSKFDDFAGKVNDDVSLLQILADKTSETSLTMQTEFAALLLSFTTFRDTMTGGFNAIALSIGGATLALGLLTLTTGLIIPTITANMITLSLTFIAMGVIAQTAFDSAKAAVQRLDDRIKSLIADIDIAIAKAGSLSGIDVSGKREKGGPVWKGLFEVGENTKPELLFQNGRMYLISPTGGQVEPMQPVGDTSGVKNGFGLQQPLPNGQQQGGVIGGNTTNLQITEGDIVLNVTGGNVTDTTITKIRDTIREELNNKNKSVEERLRSAGKA